MKATEKIIFAVLLLSQVSCGGGGGGSSTSSNLKKGVFLDSAVSGLEYETTTRSGITGTDGSFEYDNDGEMIRFLIGGKSIGIAKAGKAVHVFDLAESSGSPDQYRVARVAQLLQTLDEDSNPENGIVLSTEVKKLIQSMPELNFTAGDSGWSNQLNLIKQKSGKSPVSLDVAVKHAEKSLANVECSLAPAVYPLVSIDGFEKFNTAGKNCIKRAFATAYFEDTLSRIYLDRSEILNSPIISKGEEVAQSDIKLIAANNLANQIVTFVTDLMETTDVKSKTTTETFAKVVAITSSNAKNILVFTNTLGCVKDGTCKIKDPEKANVEIMIASLEVMASSARCINKDIDKCAELLKQSNEVGSLIEAYYGALPKSESDAFYNKLVAWFQVASDVVGIAESQASVFSAVGSALDTAVKTGTNYFGRTDADTAKRDNIVNILEIMSEASRISWSCAGSKLFSMDIKAQARCISEVAKYVNQRSAEIFSYTFAMASVKDLRDLADDLEVASLVLAEMVKNEGLNSTLANYSISREFKNTREALRFLLIKVAEKYSLSDARNRYVNERILAGSFYADRVIDNIVSYQRITSSKAKAIMEGRYTNCASMNLDDIVIGDVKSISGLKIGEVGKDISFAANFRPSSAILGFLIRDSEGAFFSDLPATTRKYTQSGVKRLLITPVINGITGGQRVCDAKTKEGIVTVFDRTAPIISFDTGSMQSYQSEKTTFRIAARNGNSVPICKLRFNPGDGGSSQILDLNCNGTSTDWSVYHTYVTEGIYNPTVQVENVFGDLSQSSTTVTVMRSSDLVWLSRDDTSKRYAKIVCGSWSDCESYAVQRGGHLVSIHSKQEAEWIVSTFGVGYWIGLNDHNQDGVFSWSSGATVIYTNWYPGEPNSGIAAGERYTSLWLDYGGLWNNSKNEDLKGGKGAIMERFVQ